MSSNFQHREEGLVATAQFLETVRDSNLDYNWDEISGASFQILGFVNSDSREKSHGLMCNLYISLFALCGLKGYPVATLLPYLNDLLPYILNKTADINPRIRQRSIDLVMAIVEIFHTPDLNILPVLIKPYASTSLHSIPWKHVKARLDLTSNLLELYGSSDSVLGRSKQVAWSSHKILQFAKPLASHTKSDVRDSATTLICKLVELVPSCSQSLADLPTAVLDHINRRVLAPKSIITQEQDIAEFKQ